MDYGVWSFNSSVFIVFLPSLRSEYSIQDSCTVVYSDNGDEMRERGKGNRKGQGGREVEKLPLVSRNT